MKNFFWYFIFLITISISAQVGWQREKSEVQLPVELFHSTYAVNLPTAETIGSKELEIETGGHFFKIFLSNSTDLNQTQFLSGADKSFDDGDLRLGFMITRLLFL